MKTNHNESDYLWDPRAEPDAPVQAVEQTLAGLRFDPARRPLALPAPAGRRRFVRPAMALAVAASLLLAAGTGLWAWRLTWPDGRGWQMSHGAETKPIDVGRVIALTGDAGAMANIARIGSMRVGPGTSFELRATRDARHRLRLSDGSLHVRVFAPPLSVVVETAAGEVIDMGCEFVLDADATRSHVVVLSGWVQMENEAGAVMVPEGATSTMRPGAAPSVPVFNDAPPGFRDAVAGLTQSSAGVDVLVRLARPRDVYTLLQLALRHQSDADALLRRAAELSPPPGDVTVGRILRGDEAALWAWSDSLPLPAPKQWWRHWRDVLPFWMTER